VAAEEETAPKVTVVLPCYNEQDHVSLEVERICGALDESPYTYEVLAIDDKSTDATLERLLQVEPKHPHMRVVPFQTNGGSGTVRRIGSQMARGEIVVWTDADMTYPNERIPELVAYLDENPGYDQVVGARTSEKGSHRFARVPAKWTIRKFAELLTGATIPDLNSGLRAFRADVGRTCACCPPASPASPPSRWRSCTTSTPWPMSPSSTRHVPGRRSSIPSPTPTATSCRCCGW
jgi:glycosyltransferase involved in cell wall biosynthesis